MNFKLLVLTLFFTALGFAQQNGTVTGTIADKDMANAPLPFATVTVKGTSITTNTDENGVYTLSVPAGNHRLVISFLGYTTDEVPVTVQANDTVTVNHSLGTDSVKLEEVVLTTTRKKNTETALLLEMREAKQVVSAISAEQISKSTDGNAAEAVQRVPGVTIVDGRFVMIRGLSERYNNVLLNNSIAPSTEVDKRTFSFDLIPTSSLDKMVIYKTGSADKPADFAGGLISVTTSESTTEFTKAEVGFGYRSGTTFEDQYRTEGSDTDWLGFDKSYRPLPDGFSSNSTIVSATQANRLPNNFNPTRKTAFLDSGFGFGLGRRIKLGENSSLFTINTISHSNSYQNIDRVFRRYQFQNEGDTRPPLRDNFTDNLYSNSVRLSLLSNWILNLNNTTKIKFKNLFNQQGNDETLIREGFNYTQRDANDLIRSYYSFYQSRFIYTGQLEGEHQFGNNKKLDWVIGYNSIKDNTPDFRRVRTFKRLTDPNPQFIIIDSPSTNPFEAGRFYGELDEYSINNGINFIYDIERTKNGEDIGNINLKAGYYASYRKRDFSARYFTYVIPGYVDNFPGRREELVSLPISEAFGPEYVNDVDGWSLREGTRPLDSYKADNTYLAGYAQANIPLYKFDVTAGVRVEHNVQTLDTNLDNGNPVNIDNPITSVLPTLNIAYNLTERSIARIGYSRTVNRPEFRELAPFVFYDYVYDAPISGDPELDVATIDNIDLRYEFYPTPGEIISLGAFYKRFDKPIEMNAQIQGENPAFTYANADFATNYGVELEVKKSFKGLFNSEFFDKLSANINASYIISEVDLGEGRDGLGLAQERTRALQGQSPYIINAALGYSDDNNLSVNVVYNRFGDRIFSVGNVRFPSWYELARDNVDLTISKKVMNTTFKLGVQDLLNAKYRIYEDTNRDDKIRNENDNIVNSFRRGTRFTLSIGYNF